MIARVIHFGPDDCHRLMVLRSAGYAVEVCQSILQLESRLARGAALDVVILSDSGEACSRDALAVARSYSSNPVVLFRSSNVAYEDSGFDLIVPCLTAPEVWLRDLKALINRRRAAVRDRAEPGPAEATAC